MTRATGAIAIGVAAACLAAGPGSATAAPSAQTPQQAVASAFSGHAKPVRDRVLPGRPPATPRARAAAAFSGKGGTYTVTVNGVKSKVAVYTSSKYLKFDEKVNIAWAKFFAGLPHGSELSKLRVYLAPIGQITQSYVCGALADSCYDPSYSIMYLVSSTPPDGASLTQVAAHEYGHHIATWRLNRPWDALTWGPKHWASAARVCQYTRSGEMWPGDEGTHYGDNPAEVWAEVYRIYASSINGDPLDPWEILSGQWEPDQAQLDAAAEDTLRPWLGSVKNTVKGTLGSAGDQSADVVVPMPLDGRVTPTVTAKGGLKVTLAAYAADGTKLSGPTTRSSFNVDSCGGDPVTIRVKRVSGSGSWSLVTESPGS